MVKDCHCRFKIFLQLGLTRSISGANLVLPPKTDLSTGTLRFQKPRTKVRGFAFVRFACVLTIAEAPLLCVLLKSFSVFGDPHGRTERQKRTWATKLDISGSGRCIKK